MKRRHERIGAAKPSEACSDMLKLDERDRFNIARDERGVVIQIAAIATNAGQVDDLCRLLRLLSRTMLETDP